MKQWAELTEGERAWVVEKETNNILQAITEAGSDVFPELETEIAAAQKIAEGNQTPWFFVEILYHETEGAKEKINAIVLEFCESALFTEVGEHFIGL